MKKALASVRAVSDVATSIGVTSRYPVSPAGVSRYVDQRYWIRDRTPEGMVDELNRIAAEDDYDQLLPIGGRTFEIVSEHRDQLRFPVERILPSHDALRTAIEKSKTYELAVSEGVPAPETMVPSDRSTLRDAAERVGFPAVVKTGIETEPRFVRVVRSLEDLEAAVDAYRRTHESDPIVQEYLPGTSRGFFGLYLEGTLVGGYAHRRIREDPPEGGASACAQSELDDELRDLSRRLLSPLEWTGVAMVEFKEAADGTPKVVEINPKFWGSLDLAIESGLNFPSALLSCGAGHEPPEFHFTPSRVHWPLSGDLVHVLSRPGTAPTVVGDVLSARTRSNVQLGDPAPHVLEGASTVAGSLLS